MFNNKERRLAFSGAWLLIAHVVITGLTVIPAIQNSAYLGMVHSLSAICYLSGYVCFALTFFSRARISAAIFALLMVLGIVGGVLLDFLRFGHMEETAIDYALPISFIVLTVVLFLQRGIVRWISVFYGIGAVAWILSTLFANNPLLSTNASFVAEFLGMNATIALIVWGVFQARELRHSATTR